MKALFTLAAGCALVGVVAAVLLVVGWNWSLFALANGAVAVLLLALSRGSFTGTDAERPPGRARASAGDPAAEISTSYAFVFVAAPPAIAAIAAILFLL